MATYQYLTDNDITLKAVWAWAKRLVRDLNAQVSATADIVPTGTVGTFAGATAPVGWLVCDGGIYSKFDQPKLFAVIGYLYGGSGDNFNVPNYKDRFLMGAGGLLPLGQSGGAATVTLQAENMPDIAATILAKRLDSLDIIDTAATGEQPLTAKTDAAPDTQISAVSDNSNKPISIIPPAIGVNVIIKA